MTKDCGKKMNEERAADDSSVEDKNLKDTIETGVVEQNVAEHNDDDLYGSAGTDYKERNAGAALEDLTYSVTDRPSGDDIKTEKVKGEEEVEEHAIPACIIDQDTKEEVQLNRDMLLNEPYIDEFYNQTYCYLLPREPGMLLVFWEIGEETKKSLIAKYGEDFFSKITILSSDFTKLQE